MYVNIKNVTDDYDGIGGTLLGVFQYNMRTIKTGLIIIEYISVTVSF